MAQQKRSNSSLIYILMALLIGAFFYNTFWGVTPTQTIQEVDLTTIQTLYKANKLASIESEGNIIRAPLKEDYQKDSSTLLEKDTIVKAIKDSNDSLNDLGLMESPDIPVTIQDNASNQFWYEIAISIIPIFLFIGLLMFMMRSVSSTNRTALSFGMSKAKEFDRSNKNKVTFTDVAGSDNAKEALTEIVDFLKNPKKYLKMGAKIPRGVLLFGPPGTGKTLLARAVAGEAEVPFYSISGSEFVEMFVGVGASRVRDLFAKARKTSPCIVFIDEIDAVGRHRGTGLGGGHDEREQTLNQILSEMDGFEKEENVIVMAATNRPDVLDPALLRPGRFDRRVVIDNPDLKDREAILKVHARQKPLAKGTHLDVIAKHTPGFSGADLENLLNEAAIKAAKENKKQVEQQDLDESIEKVLLGPEKKNKIMSEKEVKITAYHEVGHAITGYVRPNTDPVHKISIVSRGMALGVTWFLPEKDEVLTSKEKFEDELISLMGGRASEELMFGKQSITTGASNDMEKATKMARNMVTKYGMSPLGPITFGEHKEQPFLGKEMVHERTYSEETAKTIDHEITNILEKAYKTSFEILKEHKNMLIKIAEDLIKKESLTREEFESYFKKTSKGKG